MLEDALNEARIGNVGDHAQTLAAALTAIAAAPGDALGALEPLGVRDMSTSSHFSSRLLYSAAHRIPLAKLTTECAKQLYALGIGITLAERSALRAMLRVPVNHG